MSGVDAIQYQRIVAQLGGDASRLVAVSKKQEVERIRLLYALGQRHFGENYVQELTQKYPALPKDICWHFIGHLQRNKVKFIAPFVHWIHGVDSLKLLDEIEKAAANATRKIHVLLQLHVAQESTKFGMSPDELAQAISAIAVRDYRHILIRGLMCMATLTEDSRRIRCEFALARQCFHLYQNLALPFVQWDTLSMGMSHDFEIALEEGSTMVRIGSLLFGARV